MYSFVHIYRTMFNLRKKRTSAWQKLRVIAIHCLFCCKYIIGRQKRLMKKIAYTFVFSNVIVIFGTFWADLSETLPNQCRKEALLKSVLYFYSGRKLSISFKKGSPPIKNCLVCFPWRRMHKIIVDVKKWGKSPAVVQVSVFSPFMLYLRMDFCVHIHPTHCAMSGNLSHNPDPQTHTTSFPSFSKFTCHHLILEKNDDKCFLSQLLSFYRLPFLTFLPEN